MTKLSTRKTTSSKRTEPKSPSMKLTKTQLIVSQALLQKCGAGAGSISRVAGARDRASDSRLSAGILGCSETANSP